MAQREWVEKDFYKELGVSSDASRRARSRRRTASWRASCTRTRTRTTPRPTDRFKAVSEAHSVLSDAAKKKEYDETRRLFAGGGFGRRGQLRRRELRQLRRRQRRVQPQRPVRRGGPDRWHQYRRPVRWPVRPRRQRPGPAGRGAATIWRPRPNSISSKPPRAWRCRCGSPAPAPCTNCHGSGARPGTSPKVCPTCNGSGVINRNQGAFGFSEPCTDCRGSGSIIEHPCDECKGTGVTTRSRTINVRIPPGVEDGQRIRLAGQGEAGLRGAPSGDLYVTVHVRPDKVFGRDGDDLTVSVPVSFTELALGTTLSVPTLDGKVGVRVPKGTTDGRILRVRGRGVPKRSGGQRRPAGHRQGRGPAEPGGTCARSAGGLCGGRADQRFRPTGGMGRVIAMRRVGRLPDLPDLGGGRAGRDARADIAHL